MTLCGAARSVGKIAECWMRLACGWGWVELKLRKLSSEKMLLGSVNWGGSVRHNIRCCGQVLSALCQVCSESGPVVTPTCYWTTAAAATTVSVSLWPISPCHCTLAEVCTKSCSSFFNACFSRSLLGLIYSVMTLLQMGRVCNLSIHTVADKRLWITQLSKNLWRSYRQEQMLFVFESLQETHCSNSH